jgi:hypothetical protein
VAPTPSEAISANSPPVAVPSVDPFGSFPSLAALPLLDEQEDAAQPFALGTIEAGPDVDWHIELLGGDQVLTDRRKYVLQRTNAQPARASWMIRQESPVVGTRSLGFDVAELWRADDGAMMFQWVLHVNPEDANYLRACILRVRVENEVRDLVLTKPEPITPMALDIERGVSHVPFELRWVPPPDRLRLAITKVDGPNPHSLDPAEPVGFDTPVLLTYSWLDRAKNSTPGPVYKIVFRVKGDGKYSAHLTSHPSTTQNPFSKVKLSLRQHGTDKVRKSIKSEQEKYAKQLQNAKDFQRGQLEEQLRKWDEQAWYLETYEAMQGNAHMYFKVFVQIGDKQVVLAETPLPIEGKEQDKAAPSK